MELCSVKIDLKGQPNNNNSERISLSRRKDGVVVRCKNRIKGPTKL